jgi:hypothetical protein
LPTFEPLRDALAAVIEDAGGLIAVRLITVGDAPAMLTSEVGERDLAYLFRCRRASRSSSILPRRSAPRCLVCARPFSAKRRPSTILVVRANSESAKAVYALRICEHCGVASGGAASFWAHILRLLVAAQTDLEDISDHIRSAVGHA